MRAYSCVINIRRAYSCVINIRGVSGVSWRSRGSFSRSSSHWTRANSHCSNSRSHWTRVGSRHISSSSYWTRAQMGCETHSHWTEAEMTHKHLNIHWTEVNHAHSCLMDPYQRKVNNNNSYLMTPIIHPSRQTQDPPPHSHPPI